MLQTKPHARAQGLNIIRVPTLLMVEHNNETGRIVETPVVSWKKDVPAIVTTNPTSHGTAQGHINQGLFRSINLLLWA